MKPKAICVDLDGTLCNIDHRLHFIRGPGKKNWKEFFEAAGNDRPNQWCLNLVQIYRNAGYKIVFCSGRPEENRKLTESWLNFHLSKLSCTKHLYIEYELFMRSSGDFRDDSVVKRELYKNFIEPNYEIELVADDRSRVVKTWRDLGLVCLQCADGNF